MTQYYDTEQLVDKVLEIIQAYLPTAITEINTEKGNYPLSNPSYYHFGRRLVDSLEVGNCSLSVYSGNIAGTLFNQGQTDEENNIIVRLTLWESTALNLERKLLRYGKAIRKVLDNHPLVPAFAVSTPTDNVEDSVVAEIDYDEPALQGEVFMNTVYVRLKIKTIYTYDF